MKKEMSSEVRKRRQSASIFLMTRGMSGPFGCTTWTMAMEQYWGFTQPHLQELFRSLWMASTKIALWSKTLPLELCEQMY